MKFVQPPKSTFVTRVSNKEAATLKKKGWQQVWPPKLKDTLQVK